MNSRTRSHELAGSRSAGKTGRGKGRHQGSWCQTTTHHIAYRCKSIDSPQFNVPDDPLDRPQPGEPGIRLPSQAQSVTAPDGLVGVTVLERDKSGGSDTDYLQELLAIQANGAKNIGFFGTRNMGFLHQQLIEILSYAMVITGNHIYTSGGLGTNAAVIRGAMRAEKPELLTVILPQSLEKQPEELHELLRSVPNLMCMPENDSLTLLEASNLSALRELHFGANFSTTLVVLQTVQCQDHR